MCRCDGAGNGCDGGGSSGGSGISGGGGGSGVVMIQILGGSTEFSVNFFQRVHEYVILYFAYKLLLEAYIRSKSFILEKK